MASPSLSLLAVLAFIWCVFEKGESVASPALKALVTQWLKSAPTAIVGGWLPSFGELFDRMFDHRHLSLKCLRRSCLASLATVLVVTIYWAASKPKEVAAIFDAGHAASAALTYFVLTIVFSLAPDYLSLLKSRWLIGWMTRKPNLRRLCLAIIADLFATLILIGGTFYVYFAIRGFIWYGVSQPLGLALRLPLYLAVVFMVISWPLSAVPGSLPVGIWAWATLFTTVWAALYAFGGAILICSRYLGIGLSGIRWALDVDTHPIKALGVVSMGTIIVLYIAVAAAAYWVGK